MATRMDRQPARQLIHVPPRPRQALQLLANGYSHKEIQQQMRIGKSAVSMHLWWARFSLDAETNAHAVAIALRCGIIT